MPVEILTDDHLTGAPKDDIMNIEEAGRQQFRGFDGVQKAATDDYFL